MASQKVRIIAEFPAGMRKLSKQEANRLKEMFRTQFANVLGAEAAASVASLEFDNITSAPIESVRSARKSSKKSAKSRKKG